MSHELPPSEGGAESIEASTSDEPAAPPVPIDPAAPPWPPVDPAAPPVALVDVGLEPVLDGAPT
jgi:hypothetical protein